MASDLAHTACKQKATLCWSLETTHHFYLLWMAANTDDKELNSTVELIYYTGCSPVVSSPGMWRKKNLLPFSEKEEKVRKMKPDLRLKFSNFNYRWNGCKKKNQEASIINKKWNVWYSPLIPNLLTNTERSFGDAESCFYLLLRINFLSVSLFYKEVVELFLEKDYPEE